MVTLVVPEVCDSPVGRSCLKEYSRALETGHPFVPVLTGSLKKGLEVKLMAVIPAEEVRFFDDHLFVGLEAASIKDLRDACNEILGDSE